MAAFDAVLLDRILEAEEATLLLVLSVEPRCVRAEAATALSAFVDDLLFKTFAADEATFLLVLALFAMGDPRFRFAAAPHGPPGSQYDPDED